MRHPFLLLAGASISLSLLAAAPDARACGGCVVPPGEDTQVTGHRMILATSKTQTTLYDQIEYVGEPETFGWFLPIKGQVKVGLSSDALFAYLGDASQVSVYPPPLPCVNSGDYFGVAEADSGAGAGDPGIYIPPEEQVNVIAEEVVGPYETVQLEATDPDALTKWLTIHGYNVPTDIEPIIADYQKEGFGFLAMKLVPGEGVTSMRPVSVTADGAGLGLPLRMVAAGTGALTPVTLYVMAEGRYEIDQRPNLLVPEDDIVWDWDNGISNYRTLRDETVDDTDGMGWLTESAQRYSKVSLVARVQNTIEMSPGTTGWGDPVAGLDESADAQRDLDTLFSGMNESDIWLTRMYARLTRPALAQDLLLRASADQTTVTGRITAKKSIGKEPDCSQYQGGGGRKYLSCAAAPASSAGGPTLAALTAALAALALFRRRR